MIHAHGGYPDGVAAAAVAATLGRPYVLTEHASYVRDQLADPAMRAESSGSRPEPHGSSW